MSKKSKNQEWDGKFFSAQAKNFGPSFVPNGVRATGFAPAAEGPTGFSLAGGPGLNAFEYGASRATLKERTQRAWQRVLIGDRRQPMPEEAATERSAILEALPRLHCAARQWHPLHHVRVGARRRLALALARLAELDEFEPEPAGAPVAQRDGYGPYRRLLGI